MMQYQRSSALFNEAKKVIPGGVNSPVRAFNAVGGTPIFLTHAKGAYLYDEDQNRQVVLGNKRAVPLPWERQACTSKHQATAIGHPW